MNRRTANVPAPEVTEKKTRFFYWWLLVGIFFEYARPGSYFPAFKAIPLNSLIPLVLLLVTCFVSGLRPWASIFKDRMTLWPLLYVFFIVASMMWASVRMYTYNVFILTLGYLFLFILIVRIVTTAQRLRGVMATLIASHLFLLVMNPLIVTDPSTRHYVVGATFLGDGNDFGLSLCILVPFCVELAIGATNRLRQVILWAALAILLFAVVGTQSRGATLGVGAVAIYLWWHSEKKLVALFAVGVVAVGALMYAPEVYFERMGTLANAQEESSAQGRLMAWRAGANMAANNVLGVGAGNFPNNFPKYRSADAPIRWMTAHSMYFLVLGELGVLGFLLLLKLLIGNVRANAKVRAILLSKRNDPLLKQRSTINVQPRTLTLLSASVVGFSVAGAFLSVAYYPHIFVLTALLVAARCMAVSQHESKSSALTADDRSPIARLR